jgi:hypothetical protein
MSTPDHIEQAYQMIRMGNLGNARQVLLGMLQEDPESAEAWALMAVTEGGSGERDEALRRVLHHASHPDLAEWARRMLERVNDVGETPAVAELPPIQRLDSLVPPPTPAPQRAAAPAPMAQRGGKRPVAAPKGAKAKPAKPEEKGPAHTLKNIGGGIIIIGDLFLMGALFFAPYRDALNALNIPPGPIAILTILIGIAVYLYGRTITPK